MMVDDSGTAGAARKAAQKPPREDRDRWEHFSKADVDKDAKAPAPPEGAEKSRAGLPRDGGLVEGES